MKILILGIGGFIGSSLTRYILTHHPDWSITGMDLRADKIATYRDHPRLHFALGDMTQNMSWIDSQIQEADVVLPLAAIANPATYVTQPLRVFELDFEANLPFVRLCARHQTRLLFPSTSEVYGMCPDAAFDEETSPLVVGPIAKQRWIYSCAKQMMDRIIYAYGIHEGLDYTLFRPFNWIGPELDHLSLERGGEGRVLVQFLGNILRGLPIQLVDGGAQRRSFTDIDDANRALVAMILNPQGAATRRIFNVGNPDNDVTIATFAERLIHIVRQHPLAPPCAQNTTLVSVSGADHFGSSYQDLEARVPSIRAAQEALGWHPHVTLEASLETIVDWHLRRLFA